MTKAIKFQSRMTIDGTVMAFWMALDGTVMTMALDDDYATPAVVCSECGWALGYEDRYEGHTVSHWRYATKDYETRYVCDDDACREACGCEECDDTFRSATREAWEDLQFETERERRMGIW